MPLQHQHDSSSTPSNASGNTGRAGLAVVRRANGRALRKSCDRCHRQKLQCVGDKASLTRCKRCQVAGVECVYSARSSRRARQSNTEADFWDNWESWDALDPWVPKVNSAVDDLDAIFDLQPTPFFPISPISTSDNRDSAPFLDQGLPALGNHSDGISINMPDMNLRHSNLPEQTQASNAEPGHHLAELTRAFDELEATFARTVEGEAGRDVQDYPVGDVVNAVDIFMAGLRHSSLDLEGGSSQAKLGPQEARLRSKHASIAAQGYVMCLRLLTSLSEQMLRSLLSSALPEEADVTQTSTAPLISDDNCNERHVPQGTRLSDLHAHAKHFRQALDTSIDVLHTCGNRVEEMERILGLDEKDLTRQAASNHSHPRRPSLAARFVASIWEDEVAIGNNGPKVYLRRYRAAIHGLVEHLS